MIKNNETQYEAVIIGCSAGGLNALKIILPHLPADFPLPVIIVSHRHPDTDGFLEDVLGKSTLLQVRQANDKEAIEPGYVYLAPPNYHLLVEEGHTFSLSADEPVQFSRPSINVTFESVADAYGSRSIGIILTGGNNDGGEGLKLLKATGGLTIVQTPESAEVDFMPRNAISVCPPDRILQLNEIGPFLKKFVIQNGKSSV